MKKKILFINPNKWGRGITTIWIASHSGNLKKSGHKSKLFDCTFYKEWTDLEVEINTSNKQFQKTNYLDKIKWKKNNLLKDLKKIIEEFKPDIIFSSAISSHIHGEGEYINIQYTYELIEQINSKAIIVFGGLQPTANPREVLKKMPKVDFLISGESELIINEIANLHPNKEMIKKINGLSYYEKNKFIKNKPQKIINNLDEISPYDYSIFDNQVFLRPYNGKVLKAVDYEMSRGCIYTCSYCVETVIQKYYGFDKKNNKGTLISAKSYLRNKTAKTIFKEIKNLNKNYGIELFRCQDTNFLTIDHKVLAELADYIHSSKLNIKLYIETRAEGINEKTINFLKKLKVDGVGMGLELSSDDFREHSLNRFVDNKKIVKAFKLLKKNKINTTAYNIIGLPEQTEESIIDTIKFNRKIQPNVSSVAYYSAYEGTSLKNKSTHLFEKYPNGMDAQMRGKILNHKLGIKVLDFYKSNFNYLVANKNLNISKFKKEWLKKND
jgi:anaerobic magnesium-protoporphyrin IX monomethyl ester cyclase